MTISEKCFRLGNELMERKIYILNGVPYKSVITNKVTGMEWASDGSEPLFALPGLDLTGSNVSLEEDAILIEGQDVIIRWEFRMFEGLAVIESRIGIKCKTKEGMGGNIEASSPVFNDSSVMLSNDVETKDQGQAFDKDYVEGLGCASKHVTLKAVTFFDRTDYTDYLIEEKEIPLYSRNRYFGCDGHLFVLKDNVSEEECMIVKNAPCSIAHYNAILCDKKQADFCCQPISNIHISGSGIDMNALTEEFTYSYPVAIGVCGGKERTKLFRQYYEKDYRIKCPYIMSNTWGDRNHDKYICEEFILKEIDEAAKLGIDVVQIDDGWQKGITAGSVLVAGGCWNGGFRACDSEFWSIHPTKFPNGFDRIMEVAKKKQISIGLWFSPDNYNDYESWELDSEVMLSFYRQYGIRYFKLDGILVANRTCEKNIVSMLTKVQEKSQGNIVFNMDITNGMRFGYLLHRQFGDLFVENRYTDLGNYYPHNTLRNLWELSRYIPAQRLQMELLNNCRNSDKYNDILAPAEYDIDYLFATVMVSNPLMWMEMTGLTGESSSRLEQIIAVYKKYRDDFVEIVPILDKPSGFSLTGFHILGRKQNYVLLFRELSEEGEVPIFIKEILATNDENAQMQPVKLAKKRSYLFGIILDE